MNHHPIKLGHPLDRVVGFPLFRGVESDVLAEMMAAARVSVHAKGEILIEQNQPLTRAYIVLDGWCGLSRGNREGQESLLNIVSRGDIVADSVQDMATCNLQSLTPVELLSFPMAAMNHALEHSPVFAKNMLAETERRTQELLDRIEQLTLRSAEERLGRFLLQMRLHESQIDVREISLPFDKIFIASYLGIKPETLSRALHFFKERGFTVSNKTVTAPDPHALCAFCDVSLASHCDHAQADDCPDHNPKI